MNDTSQPTSPRRAATAARIARHRQLVELALEGASSREIAAELGISHQRVCRIAFRCGIKQIAKPGGTRRIAVWVPNSRLQVLDVISRAAGVTRDEMLSRIASISLQDERSARRLLGKAALPKRPYRRRPPLEAADLERGPL